VFINKKYFEKQPLSQYQTDSNYIMVKIAFQNIFLIKRNNFFILKKISDINASK